MKDEFVKYVFDAESLVRKRSLRQLGLFPLREHLHALIQKHLSMPIQECSPVLVGDALYVVITQAIERMKPPTGEADAITHRNYTYLYEFILRGKERQLVEEALAVERSTFYKIRQDALENLAVMLWELESKEESDMMGKILHNLARPPYSKFVERYDPQGRRNYIDDIIIPELKDGRAWIVAITGNAGVGKSSLAYAVAEKTILARKSLLLPFEAVVWISFRQGEPEPGKQGYDGIASLASMSSVFDVIGSTLGYRAVYTATLDEKKKIVDELINERVCLFVLDNLDSDWILDPVFVKDLENFIQQLPRPHKALVTFRNDQNWKGQTSIEIKSMTMHEAEAFLKDEASLRRQSPFAETEFRKVYEKTLGVPLAMRWALGLTRVYGYTLDEALDFELFGKEMLRFMYEKAYQRLPIAAQKILLVIPHFIDLAFPEPLEYMTSVSGAEQVEQLGRLYRGHLIESTRVEETQGFGYSLLPFVREFIGQIRANPQSKINNLSMQEFLVQASDRMADYYIQRLSACRNHKESVLLLLKVEKRNIIKAMDWCWAHDDTRFVVIFDMIGVFLGTLHYLQERENWGRRSVEFLEKNDRSEEANWYLIRDVAWTLARKGTIVDLEESERLFNEALERASINKWMKNKALVLTNLGRIMINSGSFDKARKYLDESGKLWADVQEENWTNLNQRATADLMQNMDRLDEAITYLFSRFL